MGVHYRQEQLPYRMGQKFQVELRHQKKVQQKKGVRL